MPWGNKAKAQQKYINKNINEFVVILLLLFFLINSFDIIKTTDYSPLITLFSPWFSPLVTSVFSVIIQKSSLCFIVSIMVSLLTFGVSTICSVRVNIGGW